MGDYEAEALALVESSLKYHPVIFGLLTECRQSGTGTVHGGQFDWGGRLLKSNGGARWYAQVVWKSTVRV